MLEQLLKAFAEAKIRTSTNRFLIALSGGLDSSILCHLCKEGGLQFEIAHANFGLRGEESLGDENFCRELALSMNVVFHVKQFDTKSYAEKRGISIQQAARELRYDWFKAILEERKLDYVLTGHHANDSIETAVHNFFRGTGLTGLKGIPQKREFIFRPLLKTPRAQLLNFAEEKNFSWREDSSNSEEKYVRNKLRLSIIPELSKIYPGFENTMIKSIERFSSIEKFYRQEIEKIKKKLITAHGEEYRLGVKLLQQYKDSPLPFEIFHPFGFSEGEITNIISLTNSQTGRYVAGENWQAIRHRNVIILAERSEEAHTYIIEEGQESFSFSEGKLMFEESLELDFVPGQTEALLDAADLTFPLILRKWKEGDYFYPLGMPKKKKIARFLIDKKLSKTDKEKVWVLESKGKIPWVIGQRIDHRFRVTEKTKKTLRITFFSGKNT